MNYKPVSTHTLHLLHTIEIPFTWSDSVAADEGVQHEAFERIEKQAARLSEKFPVWLDPAGTEAPIGVRLKGKDQDSLLLAADALGLFMSCMDEIVFLVAVED